MFWPAEIIFQVKRAMAATAPPWYFNAGIKAFLTGLDTCQRITNGSRFLPYRINSDMRWIPTCHPAINGVRYEDKKMMPHFDLMRPKHDGLHYEGMHPPYRLLDRYSIGDRKTPEECGRLDKLKRFDGYHSREAIPALRVLGYDTTGLKVEA
jgi:hypothetical protein